MIASKTTLLFLIAVAPASCLVTPTFSVSEKQEGDCPGSCPFDNATWSLQNFTDCVSELQTGWGGCIFSGYMNLTGTEATTPCVKNDIDRVYMTIEPANLTLPFELLEDFPEGQGIVLSYDYPLNMTCEYASVPLLTEVTTETPGASQVCPVDTTVARNNTVVASAKVGDSTLRVPMAEYNTIALELMDVKATECLKLVSANYNGTYFTLSASGKTDGVEANLIVGFSLVILGVTSLLY